MERTFIQQMADFVSGLKYDNLPPAVVAQAKTCIIDALECNINTMTDERGEAAFLSPLKNLDGMKSTLFRKGAKADAADAAYYNSVKQSITSRNDTSLNALCHPGAVIVPTVIALAEEFNASGKRIIEAVVAGYETMIRFGTFLFIGDKTAVNRQSIPIEIDYPMIKVGNQVITFGKTIIIRSKTNVPII